MGDTAGTMACCSGGKALSLLETVPGSLSFNFFIFKKVYAGFKGAGSVKKPTSPASPHQPLSPVSFSAPLTGWAGRPGAQAQCRVPRSGVTGPAAHGARQAARERHTG